MANVLGIINTFLIFLLIGAIVFISYKVIIKKNDYLSPATSPITNIMTMVNEIKNAPKEEKPYSVSSSGIKFDKDVEINGKIKIGENGKYTLTTDVNKDLTLNRDNTPLLKFIDMSKNGDKYVDTKLCFNNDCSKYLNINKLYGITTNQSLTKI